MFRSADLKRRGATDWQIRKAVTSGDLIRLRAGWLAQARADPVVVSAVRRGGVLGCVSALRHHGIWVPPGYDTLHVRFSKSLRGQVSTSCHGQGPPPPATDAVDPVDIALGCAVGCMSAEDWIATCDSALNSRRVHRADVVARVGARGRELLSKCDHRSQSGTESLVRVRLRALGFNVVVQPEIDGVGFVDLRVGKLLIECDSKAHHTSLANYQNDRRRDRIALSRGWMTMRVTYDDVVFGWDDVLGSVRSITLPERHRIRGSNGQTCPCPVPGWDT